MFCPRLLLGCSWQFSLVRVASFRLFLRVAIFYGKIMNSDKHWIIFLYGENQFVCSWKNCRREKQKKNKKWLIIISVLSIAIVFWHFHFSCLYLLYGGKHIWLHAKSRHKDIIREKCPYKLQHKRLKSRLWREINTFPSFSFLKRILSIFWRKMDEPNLSKVDIQMFNPARTSHFINTVHCFNWKLEK